MYREQDHKYDDQYLGANDDSATDPLPPCKDTLQKSDPPKPDKKSPERDKLDLGGSELFDVEFSNHDEWGKSKRASVMTYDKKLNKTRN
jgi:hypothetical protein